MILISFFFPGLIISEFIGMEKGCFFQHFQHTLFNGILSSLVNVGAFYGVTELLGANGVSPFSGISTPQKIILSFLYNMKDDTGYRMILTQVRDKQLYDLTRDKIATNFIISIFGIYCFSESFFGANQFNTHSFYTMSRGSFLILVISSTLGIAAGGLMAILQKNIKAIRDDVTTEVLFVFCVCYMVSFVGSIKSVYLCEELGLIMFGLTLSAFSRYNLSSDSAERLNFLLQLISRLCRMSVLSIAGVLAVYHVYISMQWMALLWVYVSFLAITLATHTISFYLLRLLKADRRDSNMKEFFLTYFTGIIKGPTVFIIAAKYSINNKDVLSLTYCFLATSTLLTSPIIFFIAKNLKSEDVSEEEYVTELIQHKYRDIVANNSAGRSAIWRYFSFLGYGVLGRVLIYDFDMRNEKNVFSNLRRSFYNSLRKFEVTMITKKPREVRERSDALGTKVIPAKMDVKCLFSSLFSKQNLTTLVEKERRDSFIVNYDDKYFGVNDKSESKLL